MAYQAGYYVGQWGEFLVRGVGGLLLLSAANTAVNGLMSITYVMSRDGEFRLIRPLVYITEDLTRAYAEARGVPVVPCGCSQKTGTVRRALRDMFRSLEREYPHLKETILSAMGNIDTGRLLDTRFLHQEQTEPEPLFPIVTEL